MSVWSHRPNRPYDLTLFLASLTGNSGGVQHANFPVELSAADGQWQTPKVPDAPGLPAAASARPNLKDLVFRQLQLAGGRGAGEAVPV